MPIERGRGAPAATGSWMLPPPEGQVLGRNSPLLIPCSEGIVVHWNGLAALLSRCVEAGRHGAFWQSGGIPGGHRPINARTATAAAGGGR